MELTSRHYAAFSNRSDHTVASIRRKLGSPYWYACFNLPDGTRTQRSTRTTDRKTALKVAEKCEEAATKRATEAQALTIISDIHEKIHGNPLRSLNGQDYFHQ